MTCDLLVRSHEPDFVWLAYCLRSIQRFATGFRKTVVVVPRGQKPPTGVAETVFHVETGTRDYLGQQVTKLNGDAFTDAEFILNMDSDTIFTKPITPECVIEDFRRPIWPYTPYASLGADASQAWKSVCEKVVNRPVENEFMRRHPMCVPRWALEEFRRFFWRQHGVSQETYIMAQPANEFSEWNALGAWLWEYHHDRVAWRNTDDDMGTVYVRQFWSWGGLTDSIRNEMILALA